MKPLGVLSLILGILLIASVVTNVFLGISNSTLSNRDCVNKSQYDLALGEVRNLTILSNQSQESLAKCQEELNSEKQTPPKIIIDNVWTFIIGLSLGTILWWLFKLLFKSKKNSKSKK